MQTNESWKFSGALYISKGKNGGSFWSIGVMIIFFAALAMLIYQQSMGLEGHMMEMIIFGMFMVIGVIFVTIGFKKNSLDSKKIYLAVFDDHITLFPTNKQSDASYDPRDDAGYVHIKFREITEYTFIHDYTTDEDSSSRNYHNYGQLKVKTSTSEYRTQVKNIEMARKLLWEMVPVPEKMEMRHGVPIRYIR